MPVKLSIEDSKRSMYECRQRVNKVDLLCGDGLNGSTRVMPDRHFRGEVAQGSGVAVTSVGQGISPGAEVGTNNCRFGGQRQDTSESCCGGDAVSQNEQHFHATVAHSRRTA